MSTARTTTLTKQKIVFMFLDKRRKRRRNAYAKEIMNILKYNIEREAIIFEMLFSCTEGVLEHYTPATKSFWFRERSDAAWKILQKTDKNEFKEAFRMLPATFNALVNIVQGPLEPCQDIISTRISISAEKQVAIALYKLASCCEYRVVGNVFGVSKTTVHRCVYAVVKAINAQMMTTYIKMPNASITTISRQFENASGIPQIIGCIDGTHIPITAKGDGARDFVNRKQWASVILQAVVDNRSRFRDISCKYPGSCHDSFAFKGSALYRNIENVIPQDCKVINGQRVRYFLVGDPAYELSWFLMKNYTGRGLPDDKVQFNQFSGGIMNQFNQKLNSQRVCVEMAFVRLKGRFRILSKKNDINFNFVPQIVAACCILHNFVEHHNDQFMNGWLVNDDAEQQQPVCGVNADYCGVGREIRDSLCNYLSNH